MIQVHERSRGEIAGSKLLLENSASNPAEARQRSQTIRRFHQSLVESDLFLYFVGISITLGVGVLDWVTGPEIAFSFFYLIPVSLFAWYRGHVAGLVSSVACAAIWLVVDEVTNVGYSHTWIPYWNAVIRLGIFVFAAVLAAEMASRTLLLQKEVAERQAAEVKLKRLNESLELRVAERTLALQQQANALGQSEAALRQSTGLLRSILDNMGDGLVVADQMGRILLCNRAASRLLQTGMLAVELSPETRDGSLSLLEIFQHLAGYEHPIFKSILAQSLDGVELFLAHCGREKGVWIGVTTRPMPGDDPAVRRSVIVLQDITERKQLENQIAEISEREQRRIGQDLHDGLCQQLVSTAFLAEMLRQKLTHANSPFAAEAIEIAETIDEAITQSRNLARGLYPISLEEEGLLAALDELAQSVTRQTNTRCVFSESGEGEPVNKTAASHLYRLAQEAVTNALKHGEPTQISVHLEQTLDRVTLSVGNDGAPFQRAPEKRGMGLHMMQYRARMVGGVLSILPRPGGGTIVTCSVQRAA